MGRSYGTVRTAFTSDKQQATRQSDKHSTRSHRTRWQKYIVLPDHTQKDGKNILFYQTTRNKMAKIYCSTRPHRTRWQKYIVLPDHTELDGKNILFYQTTHNKMASSLPDPTKQGDNCSIKAYTHYMTSTTQSKVHDTTPHRARFMTLHYTQQGS